MVQKHALLPTRYTRTLITHSIRLRERHGHCPRGLTGSSTTGPLAAEASLCQRSWQPTACKPVPCPSKHCCAPPFHNCPSILARLAHGIIGTCASCSTSYYQRPCRLAAHPLPPRTIKARVHVLLTRWHRRSSGSSGWWVGRACPVVLNPACICEVCDM
jgi:hypothetical protein